MNSEELELSLRTEFESYLKGVLAGMQQDVADFQKNFETEFEKHKAQTDEAFRNLSARFTSDLKFDQAFTESVVEHLRLARDDGAQLTAKAFGDAQDLERDTASVAHYDGLRDAINEIGLQTTQSEILRSLVDQLSQFTSRGAFFIVKHDTFVCWRKFDRDGHSEDERVREIHFPIAADTLLADAARSMSTKDNASNTHGEDAVFLDAIGFGRPDRMFAVPLVARGRGVAVFYTDQGANGEGLNLEAVESLIRVAGLTVELRAATATAHPTTEAAAYVPMQPTETASEVEAEVESPEPDHASVDEEYTPVVESPVEEYTGEVAVEETEVQYSQMPVAEDAAAVDADAAGYFEPVAVEEEEEELVVSETLPEAEQIEAAVETRTEEPVSDFAFAPSDSYDASADEEPDAVEEYAYATETKNGSNGHAYEPAPEPVVEVAAAQPAKRRLSDRHVDLPIEVADDERRAHNDARRFARLLVSEIKLYNEQRVNEGRDAGDLYDRLREAIERSREMYDKRVMPEVAAKFDYFHYELVSNLAEGNVAKLGSSYPGSKV